MVTSVQPFLMFEGRAEEAMNFYVSVFPDAAITKVQHYGANGPGIPGKVLRGWLRIAGHTVLCGDSATTPNFTFRPTCSICVDCDNEAEMDQIYAGLSKGGTILMELADYGVTRKFAWLYDRFGACWQLNLP